MRAGSLILIVGENAGEVLGQLGELGRPPSPSLSGGSDELQGAGLLGSIVERAGEALTA